jgi:plastocyanin
MRKIIALSLAFLGVLVISGCSLYGGSSTSTPVVTPASTQGSNVVNIQNFAFNPGTLTVKKGTTVTWTNNDAAQHQIKSATFNSSQFGKGQTFSFTFNDAGTFDYSCAIHPSMLGKIIVE